MKYIKTFERFEKWNGIDDIYYILHIKKSLLNFQVALDKIGCIEEFRDDWGIDDWEYDIQEDNIVYFKKESIYFISERNMIDKYNFTVRGVYENVKGLTAGKEFGGTIEITDSDIEKYNIKQNSHKYNI